MKRTRWKWKLAVVILIGYMAVGINMEIPGAEVRADDSITEITIEQKVEQLVAECKESGSTTEYAMALWFHDWLIYHADYDETRTEYGADGVLLKGRGVCQSYTTAYKLLLDWVGIENMIVVAPEMDHTWNIAKINGIWTHIDCTWDDPVSGCEPNNLARGGMENHQYFGLSDADMAKDHTWNRSDYPECFTIQRELSQTLLPAPYSLMNQVAGIDFSLIDSSGRTLTRKDFATGNTLLVFGRPTCPNTMWFVNEIIPWKDVLEKNQLNVIIVFEDAQQVAESAGQIPFTCTYQADSGMEHWKFNSRIGLTGGYILPQLVLQNAQGYAFYYSTGFVEEPERILATALQKLPETEDISQPECNEHSPETDAEVPPSCEEEGKTEGSHCSVCGKILTKQEMIPAAGHKWDDGTITKQSTETEAGVKTFTCTLCGKTKTETIDATGTTEQDKPIEPDKPGTTKPSVPSAPGGQTDNTVKVQSVKLSGETKKLAAGKKIQLSAIVTPDTATDKTLSWESSNTKYATVDSNGKVTAKAKGAGKTVTITATAKDGSGVKASYRITIMKDAVKSVKLNNPPKTVKAGKNVKLKAVVKTTGKKANKTLQWESSNKKYATVTNKGVVKTKKAGKGKKVKITVMSTDGSNKKASVTLKLK